MSATAIEASALVKTYPLSNMFATAKSVKALDGITFDVPAGTIFGLLGPNGAGKSTTVKILTTLTLPDSGTGLVAGLDVLKDADKVRRAIGIVSQKPQFDPEATGRENLVLQGRLYGVPTGESRVRALALLERFGLRDAANRIVKTYSGGMQRKLDVALGLMHRPRVLFLDEPTTGLDPEARADMWNEISRLAYEDGLTILLTTHYLDEADQLASQLAIVDRGRIVANGTPEQLKRELNGDAIQIELADPAVNGTATSALAKVGGVSEITQLDHSLRARVENGASAVPTVLAALEAAGVAVASVTISRPSLDDVYLRHAGRAFAAAEAEAAVKATVGQKSEVAA